MAVNKPVGGNARKGLSTFWRQGSILVAVHLVSPWNTEASQPQLPRFRPDGQPPERPQLDGSVAPNVRTPALLSHRARNDHAVTLLKGYEHEKRTSRGRSPRDALGRSAPED
jgi:hypothetical protein